MLHLIKSCYFSNQVKLATNSSKLKVLLTRKIPPQTWIDGTNSSKFWLKAFFLPQAFLTAVQLNFAKTMSKVVKKQNNLFRVRTFYSLKLNTYKDKAIHLVIKLKELLDTV